MPIEWPNTRPTLLGKMSNTSSCENDKKEAWREFYNLYKPPFYTLCQYMNMSKDETEDMVQKCLLKIVEKLKDGGIEYDPTRGRLRALLNVIVLREIQTSRKSFANRLRGSGNEEIHSLLERLSDGLENLANELEDARAKWEAIELVRKKIEETHEDVKTKEWHYFILNCCKIIDAKEAAKKLNITIDAFYKICSRLKKEIRERRNELEGE